MKFALEYPYSADWRLGYLRKSKKDGRVRVDLVNSSSCRSTTLYSRYLVSVNLGRYLTESEEVDHIDNNPENDDISNLQILSIEEYKAKTKRFCEGLTLIEYTCGNCKVTFQARPKNPNNVKFFCSRRCNGLLNSKMPHFQRVTNRTEISSEIHDKIVQLRQSGHSDYKISDITGVDRSKVFRYRKINFID